ncbi:hypothetical protein Cylst_1371 [Cylindrospermum stagnale PCC 7417]|uniref:Uncharacterized protein n=1 Tax=Cylindrospermum stagnale PCC 7417 TaxID=56107 RepID=K9WTF8_9NOST|nr:hypothetical protein Cylst_1371 [Cylindrospermum stagnale PCC 7417]
MNFSKSRIPNLTSKVITVIEHFTKLSPEKLELSPKIKYA